MDGGVYLVVHALNGFRATLPNCKEHDQSISFSIDGNKSVYGSPSIEISGMSFSLTRLSRVTMKESKTF